MPGTPIGSRHRNYGTSSLYLKGLLKISSGIHKGQEYVTRIFKSMLTLPSIFALKALTRPYFTYKGRTGMSSSLFCCNYLPEILSLSRCVAF